MNTYQKRLDLVKRAEALVDKLGSDDFLDELVHQVKSEEASEINNQGPKAQAEFLLDEYGIENFEKLLNDVSGEKSDAPA